MFLVLTAVLHLLQNVESTSSAGQLFVGGVFPIVSPDGTLNSLGCQRRAGFLQAVKDMNNKTDGINDDILPNVVVKMAVRDSHVTFSNTVVQTLDMTNSRFLPHGVHAVIGAAIDSVSEAMAGILAGVDLPQIACKSHQSSHDLMIITTSHYPTLT